MIHFVVHGHAEPAGSKRAVPIGRNGRWGVIDANPKAMHWRERVAQEAARAMVGRPLLRDALAVEFRFYVPRPKGHFGAKGLRPSAPAYPTSAPDLLKRARNVEDAMTGLVYANDAQITEEVLSKEYGEPERVEITVMPLESQVSALPVAEQTSLVGEMRG
jgi:Holliday junction resolvase RusA-like endonuclease